MSHHVLDTVSGLGARHRRIMSSARLKATLAVFVTAVVVSGAAMTYVLVSRIFDRLTPPIRADLEAKARAAARDLAQREEYPLVLKDPALLARNLREYARTPDLVGIAVSDADGQLLALQGAPSADLFRGNPGDVRLVERGLTSWSLAHIEGRVIGKVAVVVSTERLAEGQRLRASILAAAGAGCVIALVLSLVFVTLYLGPVIKLTEDALAGLKDLNSTLETRVSERTAELTDANGKLAESLQQLKEAQAQVVSASRRAGMADVATAVLHNVGNVLNSVNVSASLIGDLVVKSKAGSLTKVVELLGQQSDLGKFFADDPRAKKMPEFLAKLAEVMERDNRAAQAEVELLKKNIDHIKVIISLQQANAKSGGLAETLDVREVLDDALKFHEASYHKHTIEVVREFATVPLITADRHKVLQIVMNLLSNARHAVTVNSEGERRITVAAHAGDGWIDLEVRDNGCGIAPEHLTRIFNLGFTTKKDGHGFGLHSAACAAREMGGDLTVASDGLGRGARFTLRLAADAHAAAA